MSNLEKKVEAMMRLCVTENEKDRAIIREEIRNYLRNLSTGSLDPEQEIRRILLELGAPDHLVGHGTVPAGLLYGAGQHSGAADRQCPDPPGYGDTADHDAYCVLRVPAAV